MKKELVYHWLDGWIKIDKTQCDDIERRQRELNLPTNILL